MPAESIDWNGEVSTKLLAGLFLTLAVQVGYAGEASCAKAAKQADADPVFLIPRVYFAVTGDARLFFHSAPDEGCRLADTFVIPGDTLIGYSEFKGWTSVMFTKPNGDPVMGWVRSNRLRPTGTLGAQ